MSAEQTRRPHQAEGVNGSRPLDLLMRELGAKKWDPTPVDQHDFFLDEIPGESSLQRLLAWMRGHTIRRGRWSAYAVDEEGKELHIERAAADLGWKVKWAQEVWRRGEAHGLFRREKQFSLRLYLAGKVPRRASNLPLSNPHGSNRCTTASSIFVLPHYVERHIAKWDPDRRRAFLARIQIEEEWGRDKKREAIAAVRAIMNQRADSLFAEFGLERRRGTKRREPRETTMATIDASEAQAFAVDSQDTDGPGVVQPPPTSTIQSSEETVVQSALYSGIQGTVQRWETAVHPPSGGAQVIVGTEDEPAQGGLSLESLENHRRRTDPSSSDLRAATTTRSSSNSDEPDLTPIDAAARQVCNPDTRFVRKLFDLCRAQAPDCTVDEVVAGIEEKIEIKRGRTVGNWMGYLQTAVPPLFEGRAFQEFRATLATPKLIPQEGSTAFQADDWRAYLEHNAAALPAGYEEFSASLRQLVTDNTELPAGKTDLEKLEERLTLLEGRMIATALARQTEEDVLESSREVERQVRPYRGEMTADQLSMLEKRYRERNLLEKAGLPRLSLFYMRTGVPA